MSSPLLVWLAQVAEPTPTAVVAQAAQASMDLFSFILAVLDRPAVTALISAVAAVLIWFTRRDQGRTDRRLAQVHQELNGRLDEMVTAQTTAARAEGKVEGLKEAGPPVIVVPPVVQPPPRDPTARTRAGDREPPADAAGPPTA
jgi:hypothetical protein